MCNSGTEACLSVLRLMRAHTGREKVRTELAGRGGRGRRGGPWITGSVPLDSF